MEKTSTNARYLSQDETIRLKDVTSFNISNYSDVAINITMDSVTETLPAYDNSGFPSAFEIKGDGTCSDVEMVVEYATRGAKVGNAVLRYKKLITNDNC